MSLNQPAGSGWLPIAGSFALEPGAGSAPLLLTRSHGLRVGEAWISKETIGALTREEIAAWLAKTTEGFHLAASSIRRHRAKAEWMKAGLNCLSVAHPVPGRKHLKAQVQWRVCWRHPRVQRVAGDSEGRQELYPPTSQNPAMDREHQETAVAQHGWT